MGPSVLVVNAFEQRRSYGPWRLVHEVLFPSWRRSWRRPRHPAYCRAAVKFPSNKRKAKRLAEALAAEPNPYGCGSIGGLPELRPRLRDIHSELKSFSPREASSSSLSRLQRCMASSRLMYWMASLCTRSLSSSRFSPKTNLRQNVAQAFRNLIGNGESINGTQSMDERS